MLMFCRCLSCCYAARGQWPSPYHYCAVITIIITVARYSAVFHIKNISQDWSLTNICSATSNTNIFLITNIFFPFPLQSCAQTSHQEGWRFYHFHIINCLKMSLSSTRTFDLAEMSSQVQHFNVKTIKNETLIAWWRWIFKRWVQLYRFYFTESEILK